MFTVSLTIPDLDFEKKEDAAEQFLALCVQACAYGFNIEAIDRNGKSHFVTMEDAGDAAERERQWRAAPDMLAALKRAESQLANEVDQRGDEDDEYDSPMSPVLAEVRAAIARAEGRDDA